MSEAAGSYVFCHRCGHRNPPDSAFCSSCGSPLDSHEDRTVSITAVEQSAGSGNSDVKLAVGSIPPGTAVLVVRSGPQAGERFRLDEQVTRLGRHPDSEIMLDDITVSRRHVSIEHTTDGYVVIDEGSLNGTYVNQQRVDRAALRHGDEVQIGKFRLVLFEHGDG